RRPVGTRTGMSAMRKGSCGSDARSDWDQRSTNPRLQALGYTRCGGLRRPSGAPHRPHPDGGFERRASALSRRSALLLLLLLLLPLTLVGQAGVLAAALSAAGRRLRGA